MVCGQATENLPRIVLTHDPDSDTVTAVAVEGLSSPGSMLGLGAREPWRFCGQPRELVVTPRGTLATNQAIPAVEACAAGLGFGRFLAYQVEPWVRSDRLRIVLQAFEPSPVPVSLVYAETRLMTPRLRVLLDFMKQRLRTALN